MANYLSDSRESPDELSLSLEKLGYNRVRSYLTSEGLGAILEHLEALLQNESFLVLSSNWKTRIFVGSIHSRIILSVYDDRIWIWSLVSDS